MTDLPTFEINKERIVHRNPRLVSHGIMVCQEAFIEIDTTRMTQEFLLRLMWHMGEGHVRVLMAEKETT